MLTPNAIENRKLDRRTALKRQDVVVLFEAPFSLTFKMDDMTINRYAFIDYQISQKKHRQRQQFSLSAAYLL